MRGVIATSGGGRRLYKEGDSTLTDKVMDVLEQAIAVSGEARPRATLMLVTDDHAVAYRLADNVNDPFFLNSEVPPGAFAPTPDSVAGAHCDPDAWVNPVVDAGAQGV